MHHCRIMACLAVMLCVTGSALGQCGHCKPEGCRTHGCQSACEPCRLVCCPEVKTEKLTKHCYEVESEYLCIPPVRFPWDKQRCCDNGACSQCGRGYDGGCCPGCGEYGSTQSGSAGHGMGGLLRKLCGCCNCRIRCVKSIKKKEYDCGEKCVVEWKVGCISTGCCKASGGCGHVPGCCAPSSGCTSQSQPCW